MGRLVAALLDLEHALCMGTWLLREVEIAVFTCFMFVCWSVLYDHLDSKSRWKSILKLISRLIQFIKKVNAVDIMRVEILTIKLLFQFVV